MVVRLPFDAVTLELERVLAGLRFAPARAATCARLFAEASLDGIASHGLNRFPRFVGQVRGGLVLVDAEPRKVASFGLSQVFLAFDVARRSGSHADFVVATRAENLRLGVPVDAAR